ncbi:hypothetical protein [Streptomyces sp. NPDC056821]|uniref:hypothetical protein n=1 Tax=unclassified Streptomyces TaxID=2593676 RepID=UPI0036822B37
MSYEPDDPRALRLRTLCYLCWGAVAVLLGVALLLLAGVWLSTVPDDMAEERAFRAALPCGAEVTEDCLRSVQATVRGTEIRTQPKNERYELLLSQPGPVPADVSMGRAEPLLRHLRAGDVVTVTMWRDYAIAVEKDGVTQYSKDNPEGGALISAAVPLALFAIGLFVVYAGGHAVGRAPDHAAAGRLPERLGDRGMQTIGAVICAIPAGLFGIWTGPVGVIVLWSVLVGVLLVATRRRDTSGRGGHAATHAE